MARARNIKPGFFRNPDLADVSMSARLLFIGLWTMADREGRLEDRPNYIKFDLFPSDQIDVDAELDALAARGFIIRYQHGEGRYIQVVNFSKHQNPHVKEVASTIPAPGEPEAETVTVPAQSGASPVQAPDKPGADPVLAGLNPESPSLKPETPPNPLTGDEADAEHDDGGEPDAEPEPADPLSTLAGRFEAFWAAYPKKVGKDAARKVWERRKPDRELTERMLAAIETQRAAEMWRREDGRFIPNPATWLNQGRWQDELPVQPGVTLPPPPMPPELTHIASDPLLRELARQRAQKVKRRMGVVVPAVLERYDLDIGEIDEQLRARGVTPEEAERWALR